MVFLYPRDGQVVFDSSITIKIAANPDDIILIGGEQLKFDGEFFVYSYTCQNKLNYVTARDLNSGDTQVVKFAYIPELLSKFRVSVDDAIWFLRDIYKNNYASIFENPYLSGFKKLHDKYSIPVHINIYYTDDDAFTIDKVSDKYKDEWINNSDWLNLSFHANANLPDNPYINADYNKVFYECSRINNEIIRFAGEDTLSTATTLHWGESTYEGALALLDNGYSVLFADFNVDDDLPPVSYYFDIETRRFIKENYAFYDFTNNLTFVRCAIIIDTHKLSEIEEFLNATQKGKPYIDLLIHEQYFYDFYENYQADYFDKVELCINWALDNGYVPEFFK